MTVTGVRRANPIQDSSDLRLIVLALSLPRVINIKFLLLPHQKYYITQFDELGFSRLTQMNDEYTTNSHYLTYTFFFKKVGRMYFLNLGVKGLNISDPVFSAQRDDPIFRTENARDVSPSPGISPTEALNIRSVFSP